VRLENGGGGRGKTQGEPTVVISASLAFCSLNKPPTMGWSGPAGATSDLSRTTMSISRISVPESKKALSLASFHAAAGSAAVGVTSARCCCAPPPRADTTSCSLSSASRSSGEGDAEWPSWLDESTISGGGWPGARGDTGETSMGDSERREAAGD